MFFDEEKPPRQTTVKLKGHFTSFSHDDVVAAVELFRKTNFIRLLESKQEIFEPTVCVCTILWGQDQGIERSNLPFFFTQRDLKNKTESDIKIPQNV